MSIRFGNVLALFASGGTPVSIPITNKRLELDALLDVISGGAIPFVATDKALLQGTASLTTGVEHFSIEVWDQPTTVSGVKTLLATGASADAEAGIWLRLDDTAIKLSIGNGTNRVTATWAAGLVAGTIYHLVVTATRNGNAVLYVNGVATGGAQDISAASAHNAAGATNLAIAGHPTSESYLNGTLQIVRYWQGRVLSAADALNLYSLGNPVLHDSLTTAQKVSLVASYNLNDLTATKYDAQGTNHLSLVASNMLTNGGFETRTGVTGASLAAGDKACFALADNAVADLGTAGFILNVNGLRTSASQQVIVSKYQDADNYWFLELDAAHKLHFKARAGGADKIDIQGATALTSTTTKYHVQVVCDRSLVTNCKLYVNSVDDVAVTPTISTDNIDNSGALYLGQLGNGTLYFNGRLAMFGIGKPADVSAPAVTTALGVVAGTAGLGQYYSEQSSANKTTLAWSCFYDLNEPSTPGGGAANNRLDRVGTNHLSEVLTTNLVTNSGFETLGGGGADVFADWTETVTGTSTVNDEGTIVHADSHSCRLAVDGTNSTVAMSQNVASVGRSYTYAFQARSSAASGKNIGSDIGNSSQVNHALSDTFQLCTGTVAAVSNTAFRIKNGTLSASSSIYIDSVSLTPANIPCVSDADVFAEFIEITAGGSTLAVDTVNPYAGLISCRATVDASSSAVGIGSPVVLTPGRRYNWSAALKANVAGKNLRLRSGSSGGIILSIIDNLPTAYELRSDSFTALEVSAYLVRSSSDCIWWVDEYSITLAALPIANGFASAMASNSIDPTLNASLIGRTATEQNTAWQERGPDGSYLAEIGNSGSLGVAGKGTMVGFSDVDAARVADMPSGRSGHSIRFDGVNDWISVPDPGESATTLSVACWYRGTGASQYIFNHFDLASQRSWSLRAGTTGKLAVIISDDGSYDAAHAWTAAGNTTINDGAWHHLAFTFNGSGSVKAMFVDAIAQTLAVDPTINAAITSLHNSTANVSIGCVLNNGAWSTGVAGQVYDARIYNAVLTEAQVVLAKNNGTVGVTPILQLTDGTDQPRSVPNLAGQGGLYHDGTDDYELVTTPNFRSGDSSGAVSYWIKQGVPASRWVFTSSDTAGATKYFGVGVSATTGFPLIGQRNADTAESIVGSVNVCDGAWHNVIVASNGTAYLIYTDSVLNTLSVTGGSDNGHWLAATADRDNAAIGALVRDSVSGFALGLISDVRVYDATAVAGIATHAANLYAGVEPSVTPVARWKLNDGSQGMPSQDDPILKWKDQQNGFTWDQGTIAYAPTYDVDAMNSLPGLVFNGTTSYMIRTLANTPDVIAFDTGTISIIGKHGSTAFTADAVLLSCSDTGTDTTYWCLGRDATGKFYIEYANAAAAVRVTGNTAIPRDTGDGTSDYVVTVRSTGSAFTLTVNRIVQTLTGTNTTGTMPVDLSLCDNTVLGGKINSQATLQRPYEGTICKVLFYEKDQTPAVIDRTQRVSMLDYSIEA